MLSLSGCRAALVRSYLSFVLSVVAATGRPKRKTCFTPKGGNSNRDRFIMETVPKITQIEMTEADIALAEKAAKRLGYTQTAYTSSSELWGLYCLPDNARHRQGVFIKTRELGLLFVQDLEDLKLHDLADEQRGKAVLS